MGSLYRDFIESQGGNLTEVYAAMDNHDPAQIVRAATNALKKVKWQPHNTCYSKSNAASAQYRLAGNDHYNAGRMRQAVELYNKAIAFALCNSIELELALGNRSAVFYAIKYYTACIHDIRLVAEVIGKKTIADKLKKRLELAVQNVFEERTVEFITNVPFTTTFLDFACEKNADVPCVSAQVSFTNENRIEAKTAINPGSLVCIEKAYAACTGENHYLSCYFCNRPDLCLIPCPRCAQALFCDVNCMQLCYKEYHRIECHFMDYICHSQHVEEYQLMRKAAIKLSLKLGWDAFIRESRNIGMTRIKNSSVKETYNSKIPTSILCYDEDRSLIEGTLFNGSFFCSGFLQLLKEVPFYFPEDKVTKEAAWDALARVMMSLCVSYNKIPIKCSAYDFQRGKGPFRNNIQTNCGWFSMSSKLKHSCTPNLLVVGLNDSIGLVALRTIKKKEELTICYYDHFYEQTLSKKMPHERSILILLETSHICECKVCANNWDATTAIDIKMTKKQAKLFEKVNIKSRDVSFSSYYDLCNVLDAFPHNCWQHRYAYNNLIDMLKTIQAKYTANKTCC